MKITAIEPQKKHPQRRSLFLEGTYRFSLDLETLLKSGLCVGMELTEEEVLHWMQEGEYAAAKEAAFRSIARRSFATGELHKKLMEKGFSDHAATYAVGVLEGFGYLNDRDYATRFAADGIHLKKKSKRMIGYELEKKGVPRELVQEVLADLHEEDALRQLIEQKVGDRKNLDRKELAKITALCARKGYGYSDIADALRPYRGDWTDD